MIWVSFFQPHVTRLLLTLSVGLGKTIQTIGVLTEAVERSARLQRKCSPSIVIIPTSTMGNWKKEFALWAPLMKVVALDGKREFRTELQRSITHSRETFDVLLVIDRAFHATLDGL